VAMRLQTNNGNNNMDLGIAYTANDFATGSTRGDVVLRNNNNSNISFATSGTTIALNVNSNGNVGIGTTTPGALLDVAGTLKATGNVSFDCSTVSLSSAPTFYIDGPNVFGGRFRVETNGNVGVGLSGAASTKLDINGVVRITPSNDPNITSLYLDSSGQTNGKKWALFSTHNAAAEGPGKLLFQQTTNTINAMVLDSNGNVGIGTTAPAYKLDVSGSLRATADIIIQAASSSFTLSNTNMGFNMGIAGSGGQISSDAAAGDVILRNTITTGKILLQNGAGASALCVNSNNNIGIGTTTPAYKLDVIGSVRSTGCITSSYTVAFSSTTLGTYRDIASYTSTYGSASFIASVMSSEFGSDYTNSYYITTAFNGSSAWTRCLPFGVSSWGGNAYDLFIMTTGGTTYFRLIRTANNTYNNNVTVNITCYYPQNDVPTVASLTGNAQSTDASYASYGLNPSTQITQIGGNVGIGSTTPGSKLQVEGTTALNGNVTLNTASSITFAQATRQMINLWSTSYGIGIQGNTVYFRTDSAGGNFAWFRGGSHSDAALNAGTGGTVDMVMVNGTVGIGTASPSSTYKLHVAGKIFATDDIIGFSDKRLKYNLNIIDNALTKLHKLNGYTFDMEDSSKTRTGLIAQEVLEVLPEAVHQDDNGYYSLAYGNLAGFFVEAIKELDNKYATQIKDLQQQIRALKTQLAK